VHYVKVAFRDEDDDYEHDQLAPQQAAFRQGRDRMTTRRPALSRSSAAVSLYTPTRARRLAALSRALWAEMTTLVDQMIKTAHRHDPDTLAEQRMILRTLQMVLRGYSTEHRLWARLRQRGADRDNDNSLFRFLDEVHDIASSRLKRLDTEVAMVTKGIYGNGPPEQHFGPGFCTALKTLRTLFTDFSTLAGHLDFIDSREKITPGELEADNRTIAAIEARARARRQDPATRKRTAAKTTSRRRPSRR